MTYSRQNPSPRYQALLDQYRRLHREGEPARGILPEQQYRGISMPRHAGEIKRLIDMHGSRTILDYGSGKGMQYRDYQVRLSDGRTFPTIADFWGVGSITCYDPAVPEFAALPERRFDGVISTDVLEHIPEEDAPWIVREMLGYATHFLYLNIASFRAKAHLPNGENAHCTIRPATWWRDQLAQWHRAAPHVHLLAQVVEMEQSGGKARAFQIEIKPTAAPRADRIADAPADDRPAVAGSLVRTIGRATADGIPEPAAISAPRSVTAEERAAALTCEADRLIRQENYLDACELLRRTAELVPDDVEAECNYALCLLHVGELSEAVERFQECLRRVPGHPRAQFNLAVCHHELGDLEMAYSLLSGLIDAHPADLRQVRDALWVRSLLLLQMEHFARGWAEYEHRWRCTRSHPKPRLDLPEYRGEPLSGKRLLVYKEQGLGDEIMFASCLPPLLDQAGQVAVVCSWRLESLFRRSFPDVHVSGLPQGAQLKRAAGVGKFDFQMAAGNVPAYTRANRKAFASAAPFLRADQTMRREWLSRLAALPGRLKVGISWRGGGLPQERRLRSMPPAAWQPILQPPHADFIDLQYDSTPDERRTIERQAGIRLHHFDEADPSGTLDPQAALISALDLVITVGNTTAHLAGGLGVETWCLLPLAWGWPWHRRREKSMYYPSMHLLRQPAYGDWSSVADAAATRLAERLRSGRTAPPVPSNRPSFVSLAAQLPRQTV